MYFPGSDTESSAGNQKDKITGKSRDYPRGRRAWLQLIGALSSNENRMQTIRTENTDNSNNIIINLDWRQVYVGGWPPFEVRRVPVQKKAVHGRRNMGARGA